VAFQEGGPVADLRDRQERGTYETFVGQGGGVRLRSARAFSQSNCLPLGGLSRGEIECGETSPSVSLRLSPLLGVLQNDTAPMIIDNPPFFDLLQGSKATEAGKVIV
jgi:hypothetical protein